MWWISSNPATLGTNQSVISAKTPQKVPVRSKYGDSIIRALADIDLSVGVCCHAQRTPELARLLPRVAKHSDKPPVR